MTTKKEDLARVAGQPDSTVPVPQPPTVATPAPDHLKHWQAMARPPITALKTIKGGRLQGMTDVNPQWRYQAMTEQFGPCGIGWAYTIDKLWTEPGAEGEILAFAQVSVRTRETIGPNGSFRESLPIVGIGGNHLITKEKSGLRSNDECWKMAVTDALSVALKMLGVAADIYAGRWDGSKYVGGSEEAKAPEPQPPSQSYEDWLTDLRAVADNGYQALLQTVSNSPVQYKDKLRADKKTWLRLENAAKDAERMAVPA
jgi:hypothetical protein